MLAFSCIISHCVLSVPALYIQNLMVSNQNNGLKCDFEQKRTKIKVVVKEARARTWKIDFAIQRSMSAGNRFSLSGI